MQDQDAVRTGGCQCGAVRFRLEGEVEDVHICHCRMCQKAFGNLFAPLAPVGSARLTWTQGERQLWRSSNHVERGFCGTCGTPLSYESPGGIGLAVGAFDDSSSLPPVAQYGIEARVSFFAELASLPDGETDMRDADGQSIPIISFQHPDHDTEA